MISKAEPLGKREGWKAREMYMSVLHCKSHWRRRVLSGSIVKEVCE